MKVVFNGIKNKNGEIVKRRYATVDPANNRTVTATLGSVVTMSQALYERVSNDFPGSFEVADEASFAVEKATRRIQTMSGGTYVVYFANGIGNFVILTAALREVSKKHNVVIVVEGSDEKFSAIKSISKWPVVREKDAPVDAEKRFCIWGSSHVFKALPADTVIQHKPYFGPENEKHESEFYGDLFVTTPSKTTVKKTREIDLFLGEKERCVAFVNGSAASNGRKKWSNEKWIELAGELIKRGFKIVFLGNEKERDDTGKALVEAHTSGVWNLAGAVTMSGAADVLKECAFAITTDTALMHIADSVGTKTFALWGPTSLVKNDGLNGNVIQVFSKTLPSCAPCYGTDQYSRCSTNQCMKELVVDDVVATLKEHNELC